ncbi:MAG: SNF2 helicase associated domain-containing protein [Clostridia bacterium]|nr:SNF2 helicase associated domain-containing protein [Clostridia bacterium]
MGYYRVITWRNTVDPRHGLGILFDRDHGNNTYNKCFFEDGTLGSGRNVPDYGDLLSELRQHGLNQWSSRLEGKRAKINRLKQGTVCRFSVDKHVLSADMVIGNAQAKVRVSVSKGSSYFYDVKCSCSDRKCLHRELAAALLDDRIHALERAYVYSDLPVDKSLFLDPELEALTGAYESSGSIDRNMIRTCREIVRLVGAANSDVYYLEYHQYILGMSPYVYDARFLETYWAEPLMALFEDPGYQRAVLSTDTFADADDYEDRQQRSNRASLKRVLKDYRQVVKALDKGDYSEDYDKEFLLKYRSDLRGLLRYYAEGKENLGLQDLPFLEEAAALPDPDPGFVAAIAKKLDRMQNADGAGSVLRQLLVHLTHEEKVEIFSGLRNLSISTEEIRGLDRAEQLKMIRNTPLNRESFCHIMDDLLADQEPAERAKFILHAIERAQATRDAALKKAVLDRTATIPNNRLLMAFACYRLQVSGDVSANPGDPEQELCLCFSSEYEIFGRDRAVLADFKIREPESGMVLLEAWEMNGKMQLQAGIFRRHDYAPELIRSVCLKGREDEYLQAFEKKQDELAAVFFETEHSAFAGEYKRLCSTLSEEKVLYESGSKAGIEWLIYRENEKNRLSFRVGQNRMYIVKDAQDFLKSFRNGTTTEYGRDLILTHQLENLKEADAPIIKMLMTAKVSAPRKSDAASKRYLIISDALLGNILEALSGRTIFYNEFPCMLRMESRKIRLAISAGYTLSTSLDENQEFLNLEGRGYVITHSGKTGGAVLDRVEGTAEEMGLIHLIQENPAVSIKPILRDFRKNIYARFFELFDVDRNVQHDFTLSQIRLNTYFDFEKGVITARTIVLRDGNEINPESLTDRIDRVKTELLDSYLQSLGFEGGKLEEESRVLAFFKMDFTRLKTLTNVYLSDSLKSKELKSIGRPVIRVAYQNNLVHVFMEKSDFTEDELEQIIAGLRKKRKYILLDGERIVDLDSDAARDFGEAVNDFGMDPKALYREKTVSMINAIKAFSHERSCRVDQYLRNMIEEIRSFKEAEIPVPSLHAELRNYQEEGFKWLSVLTRYSMGGILADDMGLGKTIQMIALLKSDSTRKPSLVVCPKSLVFNWVSEFARFDGSTEVMAVYGPDSRRSEIIAGISGRKKAVYITSYDSLRNDIAKYTGEFNYVILDEAQYIKNVNALKTRSVKELKAVHRFAMTGTPIENSIIDLWSIFDFIMPGYFEELSRFRDTDTALIARKAAPFILRRVKEDVLEDLPPKYERVLSADMSDGQRKVYDAMRLEAKKALQSGGKAFDLLPYLTRLRQVCVDPGMFVEDYRGGSGKMDMLAALIPEYLEAGHRILIFSQFVKALESVERMLKAKGIPAYFLSGATPAKDRVDMMDSFNNGSGTNVFLISLKAGGTGLNLTGADTVIHLDPWWNVAAENQASDRTHRIGQIRNVEVIKLIAGDSIEQRVVELQDMKKEVIRQVISDDDGSVTSASLEDIAFVLE